MPKDESAPGSTPRGSIERNHGTFGTSALTQTTDSLVTCRRNGLKPPAAPGQGKSCERFCAQRVLVWLHGLYNELMLRIQHFRTAKLLSIMMSFSYAISKNSMSQKVGRMTHPSKPQRMGFGLQQPGIIASKIRSHFGTTNS